MILTNRSEKIIRILARFPKTQPVTTSIISDELRISTRSVQRELVQVEDWLKSHHFKLVRKRGTGLILDEPPERIRELLALLDDQSTTETVPTEDKEARQNAIKEELLLSNEPLKSFYFTDKFWISDGTFANDLTQITPWFEKYGLKLIRRSGLGIFIEGKELEKRRAMTANFEAHRYAGTFSEDIKKDEIYEEIEATYGISKDVAIQVNDILEKSETKLNLRFSDNGFLNLLFYITLSLQHMNNGHTIELNVNDYGDLLMTTEYAVAEKMTDYLRNVFHLNIPRDETIGIALQLNATKLLSKGYRDLTQSRDINIHELIISIVKSVSNDLKIDFTQDTVFLNDLTAHIKPTIGRLRADIPADNPLLDTLKADYPDIYAACEHASYFLVKALGIEKVPESEIGFLTIHFGAAMERKEKQHRRIATIIVCPTGIGTSRLLAADLSKEYPELDIRGTMSAFRINTKQLLQDGIEFVISTVKLNIGVRYVQVSTMLTKQDRMLLKSKIDIILRQKQVSFSQTTHSSHSITREAVMYFSTLGTEIYALIDNIKLVHAPILHNRKELISYSASIFAADLDMEHHLCEVLTARDNLSDTYIRQFHALLLHGISDQIAHPCFGYVQLELPFYEDGKKVILGAIVSFIPEGPLKDISASITSEAIGTLIEKPELLENIRAENTDKVKEIMEHSLLRFYRQAIAEKLHLPT